MGVPLSAIAAMMGDGGPVLVRALPAQLVAQDPNDGRLGEASLYLPAHILAESYGPVPSTSFGHNASWRIQGNRLYVSGSSDVGSYSASAYIPAHRFGLTRVYSITVGIADD